MIYALEAWSSGDLEPHIYWEESPTVEIKEFTQADDARRLALGPVDNQHVSRDLAEMSRMAGED